MKILYLHQYFATQKGKTGTRSYEFARYLVGKGHQVTMITSGLANELFPVPEGMKYAMQNKLFLDLCPRLVSDAAEILEEIL